MAPSDDSRPLEKWFYANWLTKVDPETKYLLREEGSKGSEASSSESPYAATVRRRHPFPFPIIRPRLIAESIHGASFGGCALKGSVLVHVVVLQALSETGGVQEGSDGEDSLEEVIRKAKKTPKFWSGDNPVLVGAAVSILGAAVFGGVTGN